MDYIPAIPGNTRKDDTSATTSTSMVLVASFCETSGFRGLFIFEDSVQRGSIMSFLAVLLWAGRGFGSGVEGYSLGIPPSSTANAEREGTVNNGALTGGKLLFPMCYYLEPVVLLHSDPDEFVLQSCWHPFSSVICKLVRYSKVFLHSTLVCC